RTRAVLQWPRSKSTLLIGPRTWAYLPILMSTRTAPNPPSQRGWPRIDAFESVCGRASDVRGRCAQKRLHQEGTRRNTLGFRFECAHKIRISPYHGYVPYEKNLSRLHPKLKFMRLILKRASRSEAMNQAGRGAQES